MGRTIVIGDIHGCVDELNDLLKLVDLGSNDRVVAVGDLTVKGPESVGVLDLFMGDPRFSAVLGNHDVALLNRWRNQDFALKPSQEKAYQELENAGEHYFRYLDTLPFKIDLGSYLVVHAGVRPGVKLAEQDEADLVQLRTLGPDRTSRTGVPWYEAYAGDKIVLFGHWPASEPRRGPRAIGLDTGCVYGYQLTGYIIDSAKFFQIPARRTYALK